MPTVDLKMAKIIFNCVIFTKGARFATAETANVYLGTLLDEPEYMRFPAHLIPDEIITE